MKRYDLETLVIDVAKVCNFRCRMCESHGGEVIKGQSPMTVGMPRFIEEGLFKKIVREYKALRQRGTKYLTPQYRGEALLHPRFIDLCSYIDDVGIQFSFSTNGAMLTEKRSRDLVKMRHFGLIMFSVDGSTPETFNKIRLRGSYAQVIDRMRQGTLNVGINFTVQPDNEHEVDAFVRQWVDRASFLTLSHVNVEGRPAKTFFMPPRVACREPQANMIVLTNSDTVACGRDYWFTMRLGNLAQQSLDEVWNGPKYQALRDLHERGPPGRS